MEKPSRAIFITVELILAIFTATMAVKISTDEMPQRKVAVIVEDSGNSKWDSYVKGLKDAAKANNLHLVICNTDKGLDPEEEKELMEEQESKQKDKPQKPEAYKIAAVCDAYISAVHAAENKNFE